MRTGLIAEKLGMTQLFSETGVQTPVTVLKVEKATVLEKKTEEANGYNAIKLGIRKVAANKLSKPLRGYYEKKGLESCKMSKEFRVTDPVSVNIGDVFVADHFSENQLVDITGVSKGKGFAGAMKRHGFSGLRASHGVSVSHRSHGSTGNRTEPGKVFKNKKMAGHMGNGQVTTLNLVLHSVDSERDLLFIKGSVPGPRGALVYVRDAVKAKKIKS